MMKTSLKMKKKKYAPVDQDMALMEKLDKGPPTSYKTWRPDEASAGKDAGTISSAAASLAAAGASLDDDDFFFLQLGQKRSHMVATLTTDEVATKRFELLASETREAASRAVAAAHRAGPQGSDGVSRLIMETVSQAEEPDTLAASAVLSAYADVLGSKPLRQLSETRVSREKLQVLYQRMETVDTGDGRQLPVRSPQAGSMLQEAQAEQWCHRFYNDKQASAPVVVARTRVDTADAELSEAMARRDAATEAVDACRQLQKTAMLDSKGLAALLETVQQSYDPITLAIDDWQERTAALGLDADEGLRLYQAAGTARAALHQAREELTAAIVTATKRRIGTEKRQESLWKQSTASVNDAVRQLKAKESASQQAQAQLDSATRSFTGVQTMCAQSSEAESAKKDKMTREVRAVGMALVVLQNR